MCTLPEDATFRERLAHDFRNSYYRVVTLYIAVVVTICAVLLLVDIKTGAA